MIRKDKVFELKIEEDDDISGIDSISLVDEPAIEINWMYFNKTKQEDFHIPDGEDLKYSELITQKGHSEDDLIAEGWEVFATEVNGKKDFVSSSPNDPSFEDTTEYLIRYKYILNPKASGAPIIETTREFCKDLIVKNLVYRVEDFEAITNDLGSSALVWRGSYNCRHSWQQITYRRGTDIVNKSSVRKGRVDGAESLDVMGYPQPKTVVDAHPSFSKQKMEVGVPHYTEDGKLYEGPYHKGPDGRLMTGISHTEDSEYLYHEDELGYDVGGIGGYVDPGIKKKKKQNMESYTDYPDSVKNNAKAVLKYVEENGWGSCGTPVGKQRANDLAQGNPISEDTIQRMYSYLSRHKVDLESSKGYDDGCGKLMYDSWGGLSALSWAESKINSFEKNEMSNQKFQIDSEEKRVILGPAMVPDLRIFRKDNLGNPYYVFFTSETIRMIAEKYMKNKYIDNNDQMHNGKAVKDVYVIESWIKEDENDKSSKYGYSDLPLGTWFVSMKVNNPDIWAKVKEKILNGFSVSGFFSEEVAFTKEEMFLYKVAEILKRY